MRTADANRLAERCEIHVRNQQAADAAHGHDHVRRVVSNARRIGQAERADLNIVVAAAWLHDCVSVAKDDPRRSQASRLASEQADKLLSGWGIAEDLRQAICHAIEAHSYSAGITPETLEARVVQDADRLDALGAIGIVRAVTVGQSLGLQLHHPDDPFCRQRAPDDSSYIVDHFYSKLLKLPGQMQTRAGAREAVRRAQVMQDWLDALAEEISQDS